MNGKPVDELSCIVHASRAVTRAKFLVAKLKEELPRQQFAIAIQAAVAGKILGKQHTMTDKSKTKGILAI